MNSHGYKSSRYYLIYGSISLDRRSAESNFQRLMTHCKQKTIERELFKLTKSVFCKFL